MGLFRKKGKRKKGGLKKFLKKHVNLKNLVKVGGLAATVLTGGAAAPLLALGKGAKLASKLLGDGKLKGMINKIKKTGEKLNIKKLVANLKKNLGRPPSQEEVNQVVEQTKVTMEENNIPFTGIEGSLHSSAGGGVAASGGFMDTVKGWWEKVPYLVIGIPAVVIGGITWLIVSMSGGKNKSRKRR